MNYSKESLKLHAEKKGKLNITSSFPLRNKDDLSIAYTPGVAEPCKKIAKDKKLAYEYTIKSRTVAVVSDGSAVLGLGNIGAEASLPVMEGKCVLFKKFGNVDAMPICLDCQDADEIINAVKNIAPTFGGINLEDISSPKCFYIEEELKKKLKIPVFHDDQHGTAIVCVAGLINALKVTGREFKNTNFVIAGAGAAGIAVTKLMLRFGAKTIIQVDSKGIIYRGRTNLTDEKKELANLTNTKKMKGSLADAVKGCDVLIGVSGPDIFTPAMIKSMAPKSIVFALANPDPEIHPKKAKDAGAYIVATGRSDYPNQINNVLAFPGVFKGALTLHGCQITEKMKIAAAKKLASCVKKPTPDKVIPGVFEKGVADKIADAIRESY